MFTADEQCIRMKPVVIVADTEDMKMSDCSVYQRGCNAYEGRSVMLMADEQHVRM